MTYPAGDEDETQAAITKAAEALASSAQRLTDLAVSGSLHKRAGKAFHRIAMNFLDLRAVAVGDHEWMRRREEERERNRQRHAEVVKLLLTRDEPDAGCATQRRDERP